MKVLMFGWEFPPHITGGLGTACFGLTRALAKQDVEISFVVPKAWGDEDQSAIRLVDASDVELQISADEFSDFWKKITYLEINSNLMPYLSPESFRKMNTSKDEKAPFENIKDRVIKTRFEFSGKYDSDLLAEVSRYALIAGDLAAKSEFNIIHVHDWLTFPAGIAAKKISGKPMIVHVHATEFDRSGKNINQDVFEIERQGMEVADCVIAVSNLTRDIIIDKYGIAPQKVVTVHNAIEPADRVGRQEPRHVQEKVVSFLGRLTQQKGPEYFIEAANLILQREKNVRFVMAGSGDMLPGLVRRVAALGIGTRFHFTGFLHGNDVDRMYRMSDVFVMPSVSEPFGLVPLEAMRHDVPVIISKQSGVAEVLKHVVKVDFWDINGMADAIYGLLNYKGLAREFQKYGKAEVEALRWERAAAEVVEVYKGV
jgi:glycosyltransferase involved in cell wall biosynthesis